MIFSSEPLSTGTCNTIAISSDDDIQQPSCTTYKPSTAYRIGPPNAYPRSTASGTSVARGIIQCCWTIFLT